MQIFNMKIIITNTETRPRTKETIESNLPIVIVSPTGMSYRITFSELGEMELMALDGKLTIEPNSSNLIYIDSL